MIGSCAAHVVSICAAIARESAETGGMVEETILWPFSVTGVPWTTWMKLLEAFK